MNRQEFCDIIIALEDGYDYGFTDEEAEVWWDSIREFDAVQAEQAVKRCRGKFTDVPGIAAFRMEAIASRRDAAVAGSTACDCLGGWMLHPTENSVSACPRCMDGQARALCSEEYRAERAKQRKRISGPTTTSDRPASLATAHDMADLARSFLSGEKRPEVAVS